MPHSEQNDAPLVKRQRVGAPTKSAPNAPKGSRIFAPFRVRMRHASDFAPSSARVDLLTIPSNRPWAWSLQPLFPSHRYP